MRLSVRFLEHIRPRLPIYGCSKGTRRAVMAQHALGHIAALAQFLEQINGLLERFALGGGLEVFGHHFP